MNASKRNSLAAICSLALFALPAAFAGHDGEKAFKKMDSDGDGKVTRTEHAAGAQQMFTKCDTNSDGIVTAAEMDAAMAAKDDKHDKHDKKGKHHRTSADKIREIDSNNDGQLTLAEHNAGAEKMFAKMDKNGDGVLSEDECEEGHKEMKKH